MHQLTRSDIVFSIGRGVMLAALVVGVTYYAGSWYFGSEGIDGLYRSIDDQIATTVERGVMESAAAPKSEAAQ